MVSSAHLPVPDVGGQHLVFLILQEEDTVSAQGGIGTLEDGQSMPGGCRTLGTILLAVDRQKLPTPKAAVPTPCGIAAEDSPR